MCDRDPTRRTAYEGWLGLRFESHDDGAVSATVPHGEKLTNQFGVVNGGIITTMIDTASGAALRRTFEDPDGGIPATTDPNVRFLRPATSDLRAQARVEHAGSSLGVTRADVECATAEGREAVAIGSTAYRLFPDADRPPE